MFRHSFDSTELPVLQPHTHCVLIPRDPNYIYAYWDYAEGDINRVHRQLKLKGTEPKFILRVFDTTSNNTWDLEITSSTKNLYIHVGQDNSDYSVELGIRHGDNLFASVIRSNSVRTPPKTASGREDLIWQDIKPHKESLPYIKEDIQERYQKLVHQQSNKKSLKVKYPKASRIYHLTAQDIRDYYMKLFAGVSSRGINKTKGGFKDISIENILKGKALGISWEKVHPFITMPGLICRMHPGSSEQSGASEGRLNKC